MSIDPHSDPWRFTCTNCGSAAVRFNKHAGKSIHSPYDEPAKASCNECSHPLDAVYDKKQGVEISVREVTR